MAQSSSELNTIHLRRLATNGKKYFGDDERVYIGTPDGRLKLEDKAKETSFKPTSTIFETNVQDAIENLSSGSNIGSLLTDTATIDFTYNSTVPASIKADLKDTTVTAGVYGSATESATITVDAQGRVTNAVNTVISIAAGADKNYVHNQGVASTIWNVVHNLNKYASVTVIDSSNREVEGEIEYITLNTLTITFTVGFSGKAFIN